MVTVWEAGEYWVTVANEHNCTRSDTMMVNVNELPVVELGSDTLLCYYHDITLDAGNPGGTYLWSTGDVSKTITVDSTGMVSGMKTVFVDVLSADGCFSSDTIHLSFMECLGLEEKQVISDLQVYPNPGDGLFTAMADVKAPVRGELTVTNNNGARVFRNDDLWLEPGVRFEINLQTLPDGVYTVQVITSGALYRSRIIISR